MSITSYEIENWFSYHPPQLDQPERYEKIREKGKELARCICDCCPQSPDQSAAIRKVREAVMTANAAIACYEMQLNATSEGESG